MPRKLGPWCGKTDDSAVPVKVKLRILERQRNSVGIPVCPDCGQPIRPGQGVEYDHAIPLIDGGKHDELNLRAIHRKPCHAAKTSREATERAERRATVSSHYGLRKPSQFQSRGFDKREPQRKATKPINKWSMLT